MKSRLNKKVPEVLSRAKCLPFYESARHICKKNMCQVTPDSLLIYPEDNRYRCTFICADDCQPWLPKQTIWVCPADWVLRICRVDLRTALTNTGKCPFVCECSTLFGTEAVFSPFAKQVANLRLSAWTVPEHRRVLSALPVIHWRFSGRAGIKTDTNLQSIFIRAQSVNLLNARKVQKKFLSDWKSSCLRLANCCCS